MEGLPAKKPLYISLLALAMSLFHLYAGGFVILSTIQQRGIHLMFVFLLSLLSGLALLNCRGIRFWVHLSLGLLAAGAALYLVFFEEAISMRMGNVYLFDLVVGGVLILAVLETARRILGFALPLLSVLFLAYAFGGNVIPGLWGHKGYDLERIVGHMALFTDGIFGLPLGVSASFIVLFIIFGAFLQESGGGQFFIELSTAFFGKVRGGPAKIAVVASSLFGMISGSAVANAGSVGPFTIPLMKKVGFRAQYAAAVESVASCGGQIMPPVMGASAFLVAEILNIPYYQVCIAAAIPAVLYYLSLFIMVDLEAVKHGIRGFPEESLPRVRGVLRRGWPLLIPPSVLVGLLVMEYSAVMAAFWGTVAMMGVTVFRGEKSFIGKLKLFRSSLENGALSAIQVGAACACAGIVIGVFSLTGLGLKFSGLLINIAQGRLEVLLILTMLASLLLGTGLPTVPTYLILAILVAPALVKMGVLPIAAHLFIFYFGAISDMTPPLAVSAYVAAGIAGSDPLRTTFTASRLGIAGYIVPFMFVYTPSLLLKGSWVEVALALVPATVGVGALASSLQGVLIRELSAWARVALFFGAIFLIIPGFYTDLIGYGLIAILLLLNLLGGKREKKWAGIKMEKSFP
ncbi:MAG: TRAP transporter permease [Deltaproteobacteria bacterium]|nr:TRAP transporter permease [Deltaproteobacteria bacterium]